MPDPDLPRWAVRVSLPTGWWTHSRHTTPAAARATLRVFKAEHPGFRVTVVDTLRWHTERNRGSKED